MYCDPVLLKYRPVLHAVFPHLPKKLSHIPCPNSQASLDTFSELDTAPFLPLSLLTLEAFTPPKTPSLFNTHTNLDSPSKFQPLLPHHPKLTLEAFKSP
jgi:hypothetical protein